MTPFLGGGGEGDLLVLVVKDGVELAHEDVAEDPQGAVGAGDVEAHHGEEAGGARLDDVLVTGEGVGLSGNGEGEVGEGGVAVDGVLAGDVALGADGLGKGLDDLGGAGEEGGAGVDDGGGGGGVAGAADGDVVKGDLPVGGRGEGDPGEVSGVLGLVPAADGELTVGLVAEVEGEDALVDLALVDEVLEGGGGLVDGDGVEGEAEDAVEVAGLVGDAEAGGILHLGKALGLNVKTGHVGGVDGPVSGDGPGAVLDGEGGVVDDVGGGLGAVVLALAADDGATAVGAVLGGDPEVGGAGVEDDLEGLGGGA